MYLTLRAQLAGMIQTAESTSRGSFNARHCKQELPLSQSCTLIGKVFDVKKRILIDPRRPRALARTMTAVFIIIDN
jgi:hypothetical protein